MATDILKVGDNIKKLLTAGAPDEDITQYIKEEGWNPDTFVDQHGRAASNMRAIPGNENRFNNYTLNPLSKEGLASMGRTVANIPSDIYQMAGSIVPTARDVIGQTAANVVYNPNAILEDYKKANEFVVNKPAEIIGGLIGDPKQTAIKGISQAAKYTEEHPVQAALALSTGLEGVGLKTAAKATNPANVTGLMTPILEKGSELANKVSKWQGRKALGFGKAEIKAGLKKSVDAVDQANEVAETMRDAGVIKGGVKDMLDKAVDLKETTGKKLETMRKSLDEKKIKAIAPQDAIVAIEKEIKPKYGTAESASDYADQYKILDKIKNTIFDHSVKNKKGINQPGQAITFDSVQDLLNTFGKKAKYKGPLTNYTDIAEQNMYRQARGILSDMVDDAVLNKAGQDVLTEYVKQKKLYGQSKTAISTLINQYAKEAGNATFGPLEMGAGLGEAVLSGGLPASSLAMLGWKGARTARAKGWASRGASTLARGLDRTGLMMGRTPNTPVAGLTGLLMNERR